MRATFRCISAACLPFIASCASLQMAQPASLPDECPLVVIRQTNGLVPAPQSGVISAVWAQGVTVRTRTAKGRADRYVVGTMRATDFNELLRIAQSDEIWDAPRSEVALDMADEELLLRRKDLRRGWAQTPGVTAAPSIQRIRSAIFAATIESPSLLRGPVRENWSCPPTVWR
jgi:hypothetical protein